MANNQMAIVCNKCRRGVAFAKYYPATGWCMLGADRDVDQFFERHAGCDPFMDKTVGNVNFEIGFEVDPGSWKYETPPNPAKSIGQRIIEQLKEAGQTLE